MEPIPEFVELRESEIPNAGNGIFSTKYIPKDICLGKYKGVWRTPEQLAAKKDNLLYVWTVVHKDDDEKVIGYIDGGNKRKSNWTRYVNCCRNTEDENVYRKQIKKKIFYYSKRDIQPKEELLVWYGKEYGEHLGIEDIRK